jgi:hypothetical protein
MAPRRIRRGMPRPDERYCILVIDTTNARKPGVEHIDAFPRLPTSKAGGVVHSRSL